MKPPGLLPPNGASHRISAFRSLSVLRPWTQIDLIPWNILYQADLFIAMLVTATSFFQCNIFQYVSCLFLVLSGCFNGFEVWKNAKRCAKKTLREMLRPSGSHVATETGTHVQRSLRAWRIHGTGITIPTFGGGIMVNDRYTIHPMGYSSNILFKMMSRYVKMTSVSKCSKIRVL